MVYTQKTPWVLVLGLLMSGLSLLVYLSVNITSGTFSLAANGPLTPAMSFLNIKTGEFPAMLYISAVSGAIGIVTGLLQLTLQTKEGKLDYCLATIGGILLILCCIFLVKYSLEPLLVVIGKASVEIKGYDWIRAFGINYILLGIILGIVIANTVGLPLWAEHGVRLSRLSLKVGVILLGAVYSAEELKTFSQLSVTLLLFFTLMSIALTLWLGRMLKIPDSMSGVLSAGFGVCGITAAVAITPVVNAKPSELAYTIGTITLLGFYMLIIFPIIGRALGMSPEAFGAWVGSGMINSAQIAAAALIFQPHGLETLKVAEVFNIVRVLTLPLVVVWIGIWYVQGQTTTPRNVLVLATNKFPLFVLGFFIVFACASYGLFDPNESPQDTLILSKNAKELTTRQISILQRELPDINDLQTHNALQRLIENRKLLSKHDKNLLRKMLATRSAAATDTRSVLITAIHHARGSPPRVELIRTIIPWIFAFGIIGLCMQIKFDTLRQAGKQPFIIGIIVGTVKAVGALIVVLLLIPR